MSDYEYTTSDPEPANTYTGDSMPAGPSHLQWARGYVSEYHSRIERDSWVEQDRDVAIRALYEDRAYKLAMMHAAIAQAEQLKRIADALRKQEEA